MQTRLAVVIAFLGFGACRVVEPPPPPDAPRINSFTTSKARIASGESATLNFTASGATKVSMTDDRGGSVQLEGDANSGTATVAPRQSAFYVLRAIGEGGSDTAFVQIAVNEPLQDVFLLAVPATIEAGATAQLLWGAAGASTVTLTANGGAPQNLTGTTGVVNVTPALSSEYVLSAQGAPGTPPLTSLARVAVTPVIKAFSFDGLNGVKPGEVINFTWTTAGAAQLVLSERTFGQLGTITDAAAVANGTFDYTLPATLPNGFALGDGLALHFTLTASSDATNTTRTVATVVGERPVFEDLQMPDAVSTGGRMTISWRTLNATRITVLVGAQPLFETLPGEQARVTQGSVQLPAPSAQTDYTVIATNGTGLEARQIRTVRAVAVPTIDTFTLTQTVSNAGDPATARWTTTAASRVALRVENGGTLSEVTNAAQVASGMATVRPLQTMTIVLEAYNQAGDVVRARQTVNVNAPAVTISPDPVLRGATATLTWTLAPLGVTEVVGLATPSIEVVPNSANFVDLETASGVQSVTFADTADGAEKLTLPAGFEFRLLNQPKPDLYVSVNGFITYAPPAALGTNLDITDGGTAPNIIAPLWDDLQLGAASEVLYAVQSRAGTNERFLVVQWNKLQLAADPAAELTFQAHLYETGQVAFVYKTLSGAVNSATTAVKESSKQVALQYAFDGNPTTVVPDLELNFFSAGSPDGVETFAARGSERIVFYGRTATGVLPASAVVRSFGPGDVSVTEAMPLPEASTGAVGQWVELRNNASVTVDLGGLSVSSLGSLDGGFIIPSGTPVDAGGFLLIGQSTDVLANGGAPVTLIVDDLPLGVPDTVRVSLEGATLGSLSWDAGVASTSIVPPPTVLVASGQTGPSCTRMATFGPNGALGTPGTANEACEPYAMSSVPLDFRTGPASARLTFIPTDIWDAEDDGISAVTLPTPFIYFGAPVTTLTVSSNGFFAFGTINDSYPTNATTPSTSAPNGVVAPFWDDLWADLASARVVAWREQDRFIISWDNWTNLEADGVMDFQVHLIDGGTIEFHYKTLEADDPLDANFYLGSTATVWLEHPTGAYAIPYSVNRVGLSAPNAVRFTPQP